MSPVDSPRMETTQDEPALLEDHQDVQEAVSQPPLARRPSTDSMSTDITMSPCAPELPVHMQRPPGGYAVHGSSRVVPTLKAPPTSKLGGRSNSKVPQAQAFRQSQIHRLDNAHWSEWQFDFGEPNRASVSSSVTEEGGRPSSSCSSVPGSAGLQPRPNGNGDSQLLSRDSTARSGPGGYSRGSSASSSHASLLNDSLTGDHSASPMHRQISPHAIGQDGVAAASKAPTTASGTPAGECHHQQDDQPHLSLAELNSKLSSMQLATSALLQPGELSPVNS